VQIQRARPGYNPAITKNRRGAAGEKIILINSVTAGAPAGVRAPVAARGGGP
jgi:hypothetical protein